MLKKYLALYLPLLVFAWHAEATEAQSKAKPAKSKQVAPPLVEKRIMGWVENIYLEPTQIKLKAKLDTGAKTSSIHAENIEFFTKDDKPWVRFVINRKGRQAHTDKQGRAHPTKKTITLNIERPVIRTVKIKHHKTQSIERPVVHLDISLAGRQYTLPFTLTDRRKFIYPVLLGRRFLRNVAIVDPSKTFLTSSKLSPPATKDDRMTVINQSPSKK